MRLARTLQVLVGIACCVTGSAAWAQIPSINATAPQAGSDRRPATRASLSMSAAMVAGSSSWARCPRRGNDTSRAAGSKEDSDSAAKKFNRDPWFSKLPPELRSAIEAKSRRQAPRGYEERLRRYFENID